MSPVLWGGIVVILLLIIAAITMGMTRWSRSELDEQPAGPRDKGRVSGGEDD